MTGLENLEPQAVWHYFLAISQIPRPSKQEAKIRAYLFDFAKANKLQAEQDEIGNVLIRKPATAGLHDRPPVALQGHMDMVCVKKAEIRHDFDNDPITVFADKGWVQAVGTTLGADNGIGMAAILAVLAANNLAHPPIEALFTIDEETGMTGVINMKTNWLKAKRLLNLDTDKEGCLYIGSAGGLDTTAKLNYETEATPENHWAYDLIISELKGGHSGDEIHKGRGNAIKILNRFLWEVSEKYQARLHQFTCDNKRNAIPTMAQATITVDKQDSEAMIRDFSAFATTMAEELVQTEPGLTLNIASTKTPQMVMKPLAQQKLIDALYACPNGVMAWSQTVDKLVETSTNLAAIYFRDKQTIEITTSQRSSVDTAKIDIATMLSCVFRLAGAQVEHSGEYPGWTPKPDSPLLQSCQKRYKALFSQEAQVKVIHAGLECGMLTRKYPDMDIVSFGPVIENAHSPGERLNIASTQRFWLYLTDLLANL